MRMTKKYLNEITYQVIGCAIEVHKHLGPGLLESVYEKCFLKELNLRNISCQSQVWVPLQYKGLDINAELRLDVLVEDVLCVELKAQQGLLSVHDAILLSPGGASFDLYKNYEERGDHFKDLVKRLPPAPV